MKKEYIKPSLKVMSIATGNIIMTSLGKYDTEVDAGTALSKQNRQSIIDDDYDEDF